MLVLALDTTTRAGSAAVLRDGAVAAVLAGDAARTHGERLPGEIETVLGLAGVSLDDVDLLAVASGPGAFTGLRIGLAAMQGLAMATGRPIVGISALDALAVAACRALGTDAARLGAWMDAARGEVFSAVYDVRGDVTGAVPILTPIVAATAAPPAETWARWSNLAPPPVAVCGDGAMRYAADLPAAVQVLAAPPLAPIVAALAVEAARHDGPHPPHRLQPLYVRRADVERSQ